MLRKLQTCGHFIRRHLFLHHHKCALHTIEIEAKERKAVVSPYMDFESTLNNKSIQESILYRDIDVNLSTLFNQYELFKNARKQLQDLEAQKQEIVEQLRESSHKNVNELQTQLKSEGRDIREKCKQLRKEFSLIESSFTNDFLQLPNILHELTPKTQSTLFQKEGHMPNASGSDFKSHLAFKELIDFVDISRYYLFGEAAQFDWNFGYNCIKYLTSKKFTQTVNPEFAKKILLDAALIEEGLVPGVLEDEPTSINSLHLVGGSSFVGFLGYVTKLCVYETLFPLKLACLGKSYNHPTESTELGLYGAVQRTGVQIFVCAESKTEADLELKEAVNLALAMYRSLGVHFIVEYAPAPKLQLSESLRISFKIYSPHCSCYIETGHISYYGDFVSKRLLFNIKGKKKANFPHIIAGTIVDVTKIIACLLENNKQLGNLQIDS